ncbi:MAG: sensor histidine kinase [Marmoricola sp.]|nr:sensor histidine kinase [Marmoricola sp.]
MSPLTTDTGNRLFVPWILFAATCSVLMWLAPGQETIPYHVAWVAVALAYGIEAWPWGQTVSAVVTYTIITGGILLIRAATGVIAWEELAEIPLMSALVLVVVWNVQKRHVAFASLTRMVVRDRARAAQRERVSRMTSHEMRTPATIALGYAELLLAQETDASRRSDLEVIRDELGRLVLAGDRMIRTIRMHDQDDAREHDLPDLLREVVARWSVLADRTWLVTSEPTRHLCSANRLRACLDTLVENAVRYTEPGDTVRILGLVAEGKVIIGVADSGPGMNPALLRALSHGDLGPGEHADSYMAMDPRAQTGLGLALVQEAVLARGGRLAAGTSAEGGALVTLVVPHVQAPARSAASAAIGTNRRTVVRA